MAPSLPQPLLNSYMQNLANVYQYRLNNENAAHTFMGQLIASRMGTTGSVGLGIPSAQQLAFEAMRANAPAIGSSGVSSPPTQDNGFLFDSLYKKLPGFLQSAVDYTGAPAVLKLDQNIINSGPVKATIDNLERPLYGEGAVIAGNPTLAHGLRYIFNNSAVNSELPAEKTQGLTGNPLTDFWRGATYQNKITPADVAYTQHLKGGPLAGAQEFVGRMLLDTALDPVSYINPVGAASKLTGLVRGGEEANTAEKILKNIPPPETSSWAKTPEQLTAATQGPLAIEGHSVAIPRFTAAATGIEDRLNPVQFANELTAKDIVSQVQGMPKLAHPNLDVAPLYPETITKTTERIPKTVTETVEVPATPTPPPIPNAAPGDIRLARLRAIKMSLLQSPDYKVAGKYPVSDLLSVAKSSPERQADIERMLNAEAQNIYKTKNFEGLTKVADQPGIPMTGRSGEGMPAFGLTLDQATKLLHEGKIGGALKSYEGKDVQDFLKNLPFHDAEDFKTATLKNARGQTVSLSQYLSDLGVNVSKVKPGEEQPQSIFNFMRNPTKKITQTKTVFETVTHETKGVRRLTPAESITWAIQHSDKLSKQEINYLRAARTPESFASRVKELSTKTLAGNFKTLQEVVDAHKAGLIPNDAFEKLLKSVGAKSADDLLGRAKKIFALTGEKTAKASEELPIAGEVQRFKGRASPTVWDNVKPVSDIISDAARGDTAILAHPVPPVTKQLIEDVRNVLSESVIKNLVDPQDLKKYPWITPIKGAKSTSAVAGQGIHRNLRGWNKFSQGDMFRSIVNKVSKDTFTTGLQGKELTAHLRNRPYLMQSRVMSAMNFAETALKSEGVKFVAGDQNEGILLSMMDVLNNLDPKIVRKFLFTRGKGAKNVYPTKLLDAATNYVQAALHGGSMDMARQANLQMLSHSLKGENLGLMSAEELDGAIRNAMPQILQRVNANYAEQAIKIGESVKSMTDEVISNVIRKFTDPNVSMSEAFADLANRQKDSAEIGRKLKAPPEAASVAKTINNSELAREGIAPSALAESDYASKFASRNPFGWRAERAREAGVALQRNRAVEALTTASPEEVKDLSELNAAQLNMGLFRANAPLADKIVALKDILGRAFYAPYGHEDLHYMVHQNHNVTQAFSRMHRSIMQSTNQLAIQYAGDIARASGVPPVGIARQKLAEAFKLLQQGTESTDPQMAELMSSMKQSVDILFTGGNNQVGAFAVRNQLFSNHLNSIMDRYGVPKDFRFAEDVPLTQQTNSWRTWQNVQDPLDVLDKVHAAYQRATVDVTIGRDISDIRHPWVSTVAKPGFSKITDSRGRSLIFQFMDPNLYYANEIIKQIPYVDRFMNNSIFHNGALLRTYDQALHTWKAGVTIYNPSHHVRNLIGDMGLSFLQGVTNPGVYQKAIGVMSTRASSYKDWDAFKALLAGSEDATKASSKSLKVSVAGKIQNVSYDNIWRAAFNQGLLPDYSILEDTAFNEAQRMTKIGGVSLTKPTGGLAQKAAGGLSQARDHYVRIAQFIDVLEKGNFKTLDDAFTEGGKIVRKWHPDGSDLTAFERQVMRRIIPFYSWFRKAIPLVVETAVMKPGRFVAVPKASYEFAKVMGVDPDSISDPFPQDRLFPSWLRDNVLGPQFQLGNDLYGANPGDPVSDLGSSYLGAGAGGQILGSLTPAIRVPAEIMGASGNNFAKSLATGADIPTASEYFTNQIPGVSQIGRFTNTDPLNAFSPNRQVMKGNETPGANELAILNWLTGLGIKDYTKPNYVKSAQFEQRDKARKAAYGG